MLCFPDLQALLLTLADDIVPIAISRAPAAVARGADGCVWARPSVTLPDQLLPSLGRWGVRDLPAPATLVFEDVSCWQQLVPPHPTSMEEAVSERRTLFELNDWADWPRLRAELRRLRGAGASASWCEPIDGDGRVLVRVAAPPAISVLRAMDTADSATGTRAYVAQAEGVWVEVGWKHPLAHQLHAPPGRLILIDRSGTWHTLADGPFINELEDFPLPSASSLEPRPHDGFVRTTVRITLVPAPVEPAEFWVLRDRPMEQLQALIRDTDDHTLSRLAVAILHQDAEPLVLLRCLPGRTAPPVLVLEAEGYRPHLKLPNLYVPVGWRLHPPLRRETMRQLLAPNPDQLTWLVRKGTVDLIPERALETAFQPLVERIEHVVETAPRSLTAWGQSTGLDLPAFDVREAAPAPSPPQRLRPSPPPDGTPPSVPPPRRGWWGQALEVIGRALRPWRSAGAADEGQGTAPPSPTSYRHHRMTASSPSADGVAEAAKRFLKQPTGSATTTLKLPPEEVTPSPASPPSIDQSAVPPPGSDRWRDLALQAQQDQDWTEAAGCWLRAIWERPVPSAPLLENWFRSASRAAGWQDEAAHLQRCLASRSAQPAEVLATAAFLVWAASDASASGTPSTQHEFLMRQLPAFRAFLEDREGTLPVRVVWLAWAQLSRLSGGDLLMLARARDRLLERLFRRGVIGEDLPRFLQALDPHRIFKPKALRDWLFDQRPAIQDWLKRAEASSRVATPYTTGALLTERFLTEVGDGTRPATFAYIDLLLAWGMARMGGTEQAEELLDRARITLLEQGPVHEWLLAAFTVRINQATEPGTASKALPLDLLARLDTLEVMHRNKIDWLRHQSRVLEPVEAIDPFRGAVQRAHFDGFHQRIARLAELRDREELAKEVDAVLAEARTAAPARAALPRALKVALEVAPRIGEPFARSVLDRSREVLKDLTDPPAQIALLERALFVAAHYELTDHVQALVERFEQFLEDQKANELPLIDLLTARSLRGLAQLGLPALRERLLQQTVALLLPGTGSLEKRIRGRPVAVLRPLLHVAAGWLDEGRDAEPFAVFTEVEHALYSGALRPRDQVPLVVAYVNALGRAPTDLAMTRIEDLFARLVGIHDRLNTNSHFSLAQLEVVEAVVQAVAHDDFRLSANVRRWLDDDEYLIRRRIHRDLRVLFKEGTLPLSALVGPPSTL